MKGYSGAFASPGYPASFQLNIECEWSIAASEGNVLALDFLIIDIPESDNCNEHYLEIRETNAIGKILGVYCNSNAITNLTNARAFWVKFRSGTSTTGKGFIAKYNYREWRFPYQ